MRRAVLLVLVVVAALRLLIAGGGGGSFTPPPEPTLYALLNGQNGDGVYAIGAASRAPGGSWTEYGSNPVLQKGTGWESGHVKDPWLIHDGSQYIVYYSGYNGTSYQIGRATASAHTGTWTKYGSNPVIALGSGGSFDDAGTLFPTLLYEPWDSGREWKMWYGANDGSTHRIGYAYSSDGLSWTKFGQVLDVGSSGAWDDVGVVPAAVHKDGATYYLFFGGRQSATAPVYWQGGVATFTDPEGVYTKSASNPILLARFNDAGVFQTLTADTTSGSAIVTMTSTAAFSVGEPVVIADGNSETDQHNVASIDTATQITIDGTASSTFATANGAVFRPFAGISVQPRTVRPAYGGGWEMFGTPFQPVDDLSVGGTALREGSFRWTASSLTGPWTYDYTTGLLFQLYPDNSGWDKFSAENPSVIAAP